MYPTRQQFALAVYQPIDPDHLFAANVHMRDEPRSVIEDVHDLWTQLLLLNMFFPFQYSSCRFPSEEGGVSLFVRLLPLSTLVTCGHMSGGPGGHMSRRAVWRRQR